MICPKPSSNITSKLANPERLARRSDCASTEKSICVCEQEREQEKEVFTTDQRSVYFAFFPRNPVMMWHLSLSLSLRSFLRSPRGFLGTGSFSESAPRWSLPLVLTFIFDFLNEPLSRNLELIVIREKYDRDTKWPMAVSFRKVFSVLLEQKEGKRDKRKVVRKIGPGG
jgi:hypothetical protein